MPRFKKLQDIIAFKNATENQELRFLKADIKKQPAHWSPFMIQKRESPEASLFVMTLISGIIKTNYIYRKML